MSCDIACRPREAYLLHMVPRLLRLLLLAAVAMMPLRMTGHAAPVAHHEAPAASAAAGHCADHHAPDERSQAPVDCMIACAALPAASQDLEEHALAAPLQSTRLAASVHGINTGADPPPPRLS